LNQLGAESLTHLKKLASNVTGGDSSSAKENDKNAANEEGADDDEEDDDDVPELVENFDEASKGEKVVQGEEKSHFQKWDSRPLNDAFLRGRPRRVHAIVTGEMRG